MSSLHPLFDPASLFGRRCGDGAALAVMMCGYFHWLEHRTKRGGVLAPVEPLGAEELAALTHELLRAAPGSKGSVLAALPADLLIVGEPSPAPEGTRSGDVPSPGRAHLLIVREEDGGLTVGLLVKSRLCWAKDRPLRLRAFLVEPEVVGRLAAALERSASSAGDILSRAFAADVVASHQEVARLLSALPELEGERGPDGVARFRRFPIPPTFSKGFPPRPGPLTIVLAGQPTQEATRS